MLRVTTSEEWRDIQSWEGFYQVSDLGRVRSLPREILNSGRVLKLKGRVLRASPTDGTSSDYAKVCLQDKASARKEMRKVHKLVAETFLDKPEWADRVCHKNGDTSDNSLTNLRWDTQSGNVADTIKHGRHPNASKTACIRGHLLEAPNLLSDTAARTCYACSTTKCWAWWRKNVKGDPVSPEDFQDHADAIYLKRMRVDPDG